MSEWWREQDEDERWVQQMLEDEERQQKEEIDKQFVKDFKKIFGEDDAQDC